MESLLDTDLGSVRIHTGQRANRSATAIGASAYAVGSSIVFGPGEYDPYSPRGRALLAHELVHTIQQRPTAPVVQRVPLSMKLQRMVQSIKNRFQQRERPSIRSGDSSDRVTQRTKTADSKQHINRLSDVLPPHEERTYLDSLRQYYPPTVRPDVAHDESNRRFGTHRKYNQYERTVDEFRDVVGRAITDLDAGDLNSYFQRLGTIGRLSRILNATIDYHNIHHRQGQPYQPPPWERVLESMRQEIHTNYRGHVLRGLKAYIDEIERERIHIVQFILQDKTLNRLKINRSIRKHNTADPTEDRNIRVLSLLRMVTFLTKEHFRVTASHDPRSRENYLYKIATIAPRIIDFVDPHQLPPTRSTPVRQDTLPVVRHHNNNPFLDYETPRVSQTLPRLPRVSLPTHLRNLVTGEISPGHPGQQSHSGAIQAEPATGGQLEMDGSGQLEQYDEELVTPGGRSIIGGLTADDTAVEESITIEPLFLTAAAITVLLVAWLLFTELFASESM